jgi:methionine sulfoxide reductase heme-binding subunit
MAASVFDPVNKALRKVPVWTVYLLGLLPLAWIVWQTLTGGIGVDPVRGIEWSLGLWALRLLLASLAVTPLRWLGLNLLRFRRQIGLVAFAYVLLHFASWLTIDMGLRWSQILGDLYKRWYILIGMTALILLMPLAVTSNNLSIRRLGGQAWNQLHKLAYPASVLAVVHFLMVGKVYTTEQIVYAAVLAGLLGWRLVRNGPRRLVLA